MNYTQQDFIAAREVYPTSFHKAYAESQTKKELKEPSKDEIKSFNALIRPNKPSIDKVPKFKRDMAVLCESVDKSDPQQYIRSKGLIGYVYDSEISNDNAAIYKRTYLALNGNQKTETIEAIRGTDIRKFQEVKQLLQIGIKKTPKYALENQVLNDALEKYGSIDRITGFSQGGYTAIVQSQRPELADTTLELFDPVIWGETMSPNNVLNITINATTESWISKAGRFSSTLRSRYVNILPLKKFRNWLNPKNQIQEHMLDNWTDQSSERVSRDTSHEMVERITALGATHGEYDMAESIKFALDSNYKFSDFIKIFNGKIDPETGELFPNENSEDFSVRRYYQSESAWGTRVHNKAPWIRLWKSMGGTFEDNDFGINDHLDSIETDQSPTKQYVSDAELVEFANKPKSQRDAIKQQLMEDNKQAVESYDSMNDEHIHMTNEIRNNPSMIEDFGRNMHPSTLVQGIASSYLGSKFADKIDPDNKFGQEAHSVLSGASAGGILH